jgi:acyl transferase domain-containing protein
MERAPVFPPGPATNGSVNESGNGNGPHISNRFLIYILSAKDSSVAKVMTNNFAAHVRQSISSGQPISPEALAYTLAVRRSLLPWIVAVPARNLEEICDRWESPETKAVNSTRRPVKRLGFVFNGQGAQWHAMARELIQAYPVFGQQIHEAGKILSEYGAKWSLYGMSFPYI